MGENRRAQNEKAQPEPYNSGILVGFFLKKPSTPTCLHISLGHLLSTPTPRFATWGSGGTQEIQCLLFLAGEYY